MYSNRPSKRPDPTVSPIMYVLDPASGKVKPVLRPPFTPSSYQEHRQATSAAAREWNRRGVFFHGGIRGGAGTASGR